MGGEALCRGDCEPPAGKEVVPRNGGGARRDRRRIGSRAQGHHAADQVFPQGPGGGGTQGPDHWPSLGEC